MKTKMKTKMKQAIAFTVLFIISNVELFAGPYEDAMHKSIEKMYQSTTNEELLSVSATFFRIAETENTHWQPLYYASYSLVRTAFFEKDRDIVDKNLDIAQNYVDQLKSKFSQESEVFVLQALLYSMRITDAATGMKYSVLSNEAIDNAIKQNKNNPRAYYCKGNNVLHTPAMYGGGKDNAKLLFEKAKALFEKEETTNSFNPSWGKEHNSKMLEYCISK